MPAVSLAGTTLGLLVACASASHYFPGPARLKVRRGLPKDSTADSLVSPVSTISVQPYMLPNVCRHLIAGAASSAVGVTLLSPLEVVRLQLMTNRQMSVRDALLSLKRGWFRGNLADVLGAAPRAGITMASFAVYKRVLSNLGPTRDGTDTSGLSPGWAVFVAGALAGATATLATYPLDLARTRMALASDAASIFQCLAAVVRAEGPHALYSGLATTLTGILPFSSIKLATYELLSRHTTGDAKALECLPPGLLTASFGAVAGVAASLSCFPLELVRRRQMVGQLSRIGSLRAVACIARTEGVRALYVGSRLNTLKVALSNAIGFYCWESAMDLLQVDGRTSPLLKQMEHRRAERACQLAVSALERPCPRPL
uniref:Mitochondrial carrier protein n=1 Tax=Chrysotila carterae TaxID=13221 RepID=A0A7S4FAN5_CHRCT|mmetsp:Transcript_26362/g.55323  ORF Transcript_26362/g.55323 Transcript_26362/m.55323 type:complete len:372 (+) Transcript_26362:290-1405(+)